MFLRFTTWDVHEISRQPRGIFQSAYDLADAPEVPEWYRDALRSDLGWFEEHLPIPPRRRFADGLGISWFRSEAQPSIARLWSIIAIVREQGIAVRQIRSPHPGRVLYSDSLQIVAVPWRDSSR